MQLQLVNVVSELELWRISEMHQVLQEVCRRSMRRRRRDRTRHKIIFTQFIGYPVKVDIMMQMLISLWIIVLSMKVTTRALFHHAIPPWSHPCQTGCQHDRSLGTTGHVRFLDTPKNVSHFLNLSLTSWISLNLKSPF